MVFRLRPALIRASRVRPSTPPLSHRVERHLLDGQFGGFSVSGIHLCPQTSQTATRIFFQPMSPLYRILSYGHNTIDFCWRDPYNMSSGHNTGAPPVHLQEEPIGTSTSGPNALAEVLPRIPKDFPVPIVVVQHMPPIFTRTLAERLASRSAIPVEEGSEGVLLSPGHSWIAPGNFHMIVVRSGVKWRLGLNQDPPEHSCRPAVDVLFRSVAAVCRANVLGG